MTQDSCRTCRYWRPNVYMPATEFGRCRRRAPVVTNEDTRWPKTEADDWCGEFVKLAAPKAAVPHDDLDKTFCLSVRARSRLRRNGIINRDQILAMSVADLLERNVGMAVVNEIEFQLSQFGLSLRSESGPVQ